MTSWLAVIARFTCSQLELCNSFMKIIPYGTSVGMSGTRSLCHFTTTPPLSRAYRRQSCNRLARVGCCKQGAELSLDILCWSMVIFASAQHNATRQWWETWETVILSYKSTCCAAGIKNSHFTQLLIFCVISSGISIAVIRAFSFRHRYLRSERKTLTVKQ